MTSDVQYRTMDFKLFLIFLDHIRLSYHCDMNHKPFIDQKPSIGYTVCIPPSGRRLKVSCREEDRR
jgi:hypothetical protein